MREATVSPDLEHWRQIQAARRKVAEWQHHVDAAKENLKLAKEGFDTANASLLQLIDELSQPNLFNATALGSSEPEKPRGAASPDDAMDAEVARDDAWTFFCRKVVERCDALRIPPQTTRIVKAVIADLLPPSTPKRTNGEIDAIIDDANASQIDAWAEQFRTMPDDRFRALAKPK